MGPGNPAPGYYLLAPARRASIMLIVVGSMALLFSACAAPVFALSKEQYETELRNSPFVKNMPEQSNLPPGFSLIDFTRNFQRASTLSGIAIGPVLIVLGIAVRRGNKIATVFAAIFCGLLLLVELAMTAIGITLGNMYMCMGGCMGLVPFILLVITTMWLMQILKKLPQIAADRQLWEQSYAGMQQQQQLYNQGSFGFGQGAAPQQYRDIAPGPGAGPAGAPPIGYGVTPPAAPEQGNPPPHEPPLPPDEQNLSK